MFKNINITNNKYAFNTKNNNSMHTNYIINLTIDTNLKFYNIY